MGMSVSLCVCQTSAPFISSLGGLKFRGLVLVIAAQTVDHLLMWTLKFCSKKIVRFGFLMVWPHLRGVVTVRHVEEAQH